MDEQYIVVDSRFRNTNYPDANSYTVFVNDPILKITKAELVSARIPSINDAYIFLDINEFRSQYGVDMCVSNSSYQASNVQSTWVNTGALNNPVIAGYFAHIMYPNVSSNLMFTETQMYKQSVEFKPPLEKLDKITIRWVDRFNNLVAFDDHVFSLRLHTKQMILTDFSPIVKEETTQEQAPPENILPQNTKLLMTLIAGVFIFLMTLMV